MLKLLYIENLTIVRLIKHFGHLFLIGLAGFLLTTSCIQSANIDSSVQRSQPQDCRVIEHIGGETCVPNNPRKVATIFHVVLGSALSLDINPIGSTVIDLRDPFPKYLEEKTVETKSLGTQYEPNLESITKLSPDLILAWESVQEVYPLLSQIAPTVLIPWDGSVNWQKHFDFVARTLDKEDEAQQAQGRYFEHVSQIKQALGDRYIGKKISIVTGSPSIGFFIQAKNSFAGSILEDIGLERPQLQDVDAPSGTIRFTSTENLELIDGDILFVMHLKDEEKEFMDELLRSPFGRRLKAVQQGNIYFVDILTWTGSNPLAAQAVLDDIERYLVNTPQPQ